jgi:DNA-directed RNA polymerase subunit RPC12/RpoP
LVKIALQCQACGAPLPVEQGEPGNVRTPEITASELLQCSNCGVRNQVNVRVRVRAMEPTRADDARVQGEFWDAVVKGFRKRSFLDP